MVGVAVKVTLAPGHIGPTGLAAILTDGVTVPATITVKIFEKADGGDTQAGGRLEVTVTATCVLFAKELDVKVFDVVDACGVGACHTKVGVGPPPVGVAVNVTGVLGHTGFGGLWVMVTVGPTIGVTCITIWLDVPFAGFTHGAFEVISA